MEPHGESVEHRDDGTDSTDVAAHMIASTLVSGSDRARGQARLVGRILIGVFGAVIVASLLIAILAELAR